MKVKSLSRVRLLATPWTAAYQAPPSMGFSKQEYWSGVPLPSPNLSITSAYFPLDISTFLEYLTWGIWVLNHLFPHGTKRLCPIRELLTFGRLSIIVLDDVDDDEVDGFN